jgi:hypothetical protein
MATGFPAKGLVTAFSCASAGPASRPPATRIAAEITVVTLVRISKPSSPGPKSIPVAIQVFPSPDFGRVYGNAELASTGPRVRAVVVLGEFLFIPRSNSRPLKKVGRRYVSGRVYAIGGEHLFTSDADVRDSCILNAITIKKIV